MALVGASAEYAPLAGSRRSPTSALACTSVGLSSSRWLATDDLGIGSAKLLMSQEDWADLAGRRRHQYSSASVIVMTRRVTAGSDASGE